MRNKSTLETTISDEKLPKGMVRCVATIPEHAMCEKIFPKKDAHYIGGPYCPNCYERWFYQQD